MRLCFPQDLNRVFTYQDGELYRNGKKAGTKHKLGYWQVSFNNKLYLAHRIIFAMHHGYLPKFIDHIDGNKLNNRIENLRACTDQQNKFNTPVKSCSKSGIKHVMSYKNAWNVRMRINGKLRHLGQFKDLELAQLVAEEARNKFHGEFAHA